MPRICWEKNGSEKIRNSGSSMITATAPLRRVTRVRAAWFGTYPSSSTALRTWSTSGLRTPAPPFTTRETVARETPARAATASSVGRASRAESWDGPGKGRSSYTRDRAGNGRAGRTAPTPSA